MNIRKQIFALLLTVVALSISAQGRSDADSKVGDAKTIELRQELNIDYSVPDFDTAKLEGKIIGTRLAKMLQYLNKNALRSDLSDMLIDICRGQNEKLLYAQLQKFSIKRVSKSGDEITVVMSIRLSKNSAGIKTSEMSVVFDKGVPDSKAATSLFRYIGRYIKE